MGGDGNNSGGGSGPSSSGGGWGSSPHGNPSGSQGPSSDAHGGVGGGLSGGKPGGSGGGWENSPHGNPHGLDTPGEDAHGGVGRGFSGSDASYNAAKAAHALGLRGGLNANDAAVSVGFLPGEIGRAAKTGFRSQPVANTLQKQLQEARTPVTALDPDSAYARSPWGDPHGVMQESSYNDPFGYGFGDVMAHYGTEAFVDAIEQGYSLTDIASAPTSRLGAFAKMVGTFAPMLLGVPSLAITNFPMQTARFAAVMAKDLAAAISMNTVIGGLAKGRQIGSALAMFSGVPALQMLGMVGGVVHASMGLPQTGVNSIAIGNMLAGTGDGQGIGTRGLDIEDPAQYGSFTPGYNIRTVDESDEPDTLQSALGLLSGFSLFNSYNNMSAKNLLWDMIFVSTFARDADALSDFGDKELLSIGGLGSVGFLLTQSVENEYKKLIT